MTGVLAWMAMHFLGNTGQQGEVVELLLIQENSGNVLNSAYRWMKNKSKPYR